MSLIEGEGVSNRSSSLQAYLPGQSRPLKADEELDFDRSAYRVYHPFSTEYPCLSFHPLVDDLGDNRQDFPLSCLLVAGTQAERTRDNALITIKLAAITPIKGPSLSSLIIFMMLLQRRAVTTMKVTTTATRKAAATRTARLCMPRSFLITVASIESE